ncbi:MAG: DUF3999 domain-containing protein [Desulforhopalus sp.]
MKFVLQVVLILFGASHLCAADIKSGDFAAGYYLEVSGKGPIYSVEIPQEIYRTVTRSDLGDIRVFNSGGKIVPHGLKKTKTKPAGGRIRESVPFFPLYKKGDGEALPGMSLLVARNNDGTIISIGKSTATGADRGQRNGYLLDISNLKREPKTLEFQWAGNTQSTVLNIEIRQSDDLVSWSRLVRKATLVDLHYGGQRVEKKTVQLAYPTKKYLKLTWQKNVRDFLLTGVVSGSEIAPSRLKRQWISLGTKKIVKENNLLRLDFDSRYHLPVNSAQIRFSQFNSMARVSLSSRSDEESEWRVRCEQLFYNLDLNGTAVQNEPCTFSSRSDQFWRLTILEDGAGLGEAAHGLQFQLGWTPSELFFVGRGNPPYLLAFGSGKLTRAENKVDSQMVLQAIDKASVDQSISMARIGNRIELGGELALKPPPSRPPWKKWLLWSVLILGVGVLAFMARSLAKEMKVSEGRNEAGQD